MHQHHHARPAIGRRAALLAAPSALLLLTTVQANAESTYGATTLRRGSRGEAVKNLQRRLNEIQGAGLAVDGSFGPGTESAVRTFQRSKGLTADGRVGPKTKAALGSPTGGGGGGGTGGGGTGSSGYGSTTLHRGSRGEAVKNLQRRLNEIQGAGLAVDGSFGPGTESAIRTFQRSRGLTADGRVGPATKAALGGSGGSTGPAFVLPLHRSIQVTSEFNLKRRNPVTGKITPHEGIDLRAAEGTRVYAAAAGKIVHIGYDPTEEGKSGNQITIDHGNGYRTKYSHLKNQTWRFSVGDSVAKDAFLAYSGSTGRATGPHLHFGVQRGSTWINPREVLSF